jgi:GNAT superfamily N-acetyltransferase|tara:strand:+ start:1682 stop:2191 length:510 start_codon:yes stop_codon:yes gene_type:complete
MLMSCQKAVSVHQAKAGEMNLIRTLFCEYESSVDERACFNDFERELAALPGDYAAPNGCLLIASSGSAVSGCVALRPLDRSTVEVKRLYVREPYRRKGIGAALMRTLIRRAHHGGISKLVLETLPTMRAANNLYQQLGFVHACAYHPDPAPTVTPLMLDLQTNTPMING